MSFFNRFKKGTKAEPSSASPQGKSMAKSYEEAVQHYKNGDYQQAASIFERIIIADSNSATAHVSLAHCYVKMIRGNDEEDRRLSRRYAELFERALELNTSHGGLEKNHIIEACFAVGIYYQTIRDFLRSIEYFERCLKYDSTHISALLYLSTSYHFQGNDNEALDKAICAFRLQSSDKDILSQLMSAANWVGIEQATGLSENRRRELFRELKTTRERLFLENGALEIMQQQARNPTDAMKIVRAGNIASRDKAVKTLSTKHHIDDWRIEVVCQEGERNKW